jgi:hypothetical protein
MSTETQEPGYVPIDTANLFRVGVIGGDLVVLRPFSRLTRAEALNLAAYLVALADTKEEFPALLKAVLDT